MPKTVNYICTKCGKKQALSSDEKTPQCCDMPMIVDEPLPVCEMSATAEHSRMDEDNGPCDDGRGGVA